VTRIVPQLGQRPPTRPATIARQYRPKLLHERNGDQHAHPLMNPRPSIGRSFDGEYKPTNVPVIIMTGSVRLPTS
jgi:hypothetical protein